MCVDRVHVRVLESCRDAAVAPLNKRPQKRSVSFRTFQVRVHPNVIDSSCETDNVRTESSFEHFSSFEKFMHGLWVFCERIRPSTDVEVSTAHVDEKNYASGRWSSLSRLWILQRLSVQRLQAPECGLHCVKMN